MRTQSAGHVVGGVVAGVAGGGGVSSSLSERKLSNEKTQNGVGFPSPYA